ncbi:hypothetical protein [Deinococcus radiodurans]|uniref:hypothetical protein n=1 Tax=Deinococcus radiodurans TaxID=1299 RepID=UPI00140F9C2D|nr:hypothetical protein [Deinococcus radiodurans]QIP32653.1 hypothetical protein HAV35_11640 [Deinococcus radiodurans]
MRGALTLPPETGAREGTAAAGAELGADDAPRAGLAATGLLSAGASSRRGRPDTSERSSLTGAGAALGRAAAVPADSPLLRPAGVAGIGVAGMGGVCDPAPGVRAADAPSDAEGAGAGVTRPALGVPAEAAVSGVSPRGVTVTGEADSGLDAAVPGRPATGSLAGSLGAAADELGAAGDASVWAVSRVGVGGVWAEGAAGVLDSGTVASGTTEPAGAFAWAGAGAGDGAPPAGR